MIGFQKTTKQKKSVKSRRLFDFINKTVQTPETPVNQLNQSTHTTQHQRQQTHLLTFKVAVMTSDLEKIIIYRCSIIDECSLIKFGKRKLVCWFSDGVTPDLLFLRRRLFLLCRRLLQDTTLLSVSTAAAPINTFIITSSFTWFSRQLPATEASIGFPSISEILQTLEFEAKLRQIILAPFNESSWKSQKA